ncbi:MAG: hypothetical protein COS14_07705 [Bacteroidetes bacterium CG02_land_8_20_14_3_00_31_25]|nr:hypothetical protein [Bacteroidota bacterium]PIV58796.1 MAG: hypothetical protein COS14_07705 [Bacteroidetes bacterium CG02_land_8_20_14_3_00_31_25]PIX36007.1 MAG: hypothetical protein COZ59_03410 [Bacteroidetes bacterium CG_4_8_14_3_um_filter_31_14]PIY07211.1 MAG: hypothetical protein COZ21_01455 [Bacteroidetes bacterium CG_4_10_14_3_um_filter_31_20]
MFSKLIKTSVPTNFIFIPFFVLTGFWSVFSDGLKISWSKNSSILFSVFPVQFFNNNLTSIFSILLIIVISILLISFTTEHFHGIMGNVLPTVIFLMISSQLIWVTSQGTSLISVLLFLFIIRNIFRVYHQANVFNLIFNAGFLTGLSVIIYLPSALLLIYCWFTITLLKQFNFREFLTVLLGFLLPFIFTHALFFIFGKEQILFNTIYDNIKLISFNYPNYKLIVWLLLFSILLLWSAINSSISGVLKKIAIRRYFYSFMFLILIYTTSLFSVYDDKGMLVFMLIPATYIISFSIASIRNKTVADVTIIILIVAQTFAQLHFGE